MKPLLSRTATNIRPVQVLCKGADEVMFARTDDDTRALALDLSDFAKQGTDVIHIHI
jgi:hypothetical protein